MRVAVIGGGPAGLVTLKYLVTAQEHLSDVKAIEVKLFEASSSVGGTFRHKTYHNAEMVSSRQLTTFSDFRIPEASDFLSTDEYCRYLELYCDHFKLWPHIEFDSPILKLERVGDGGHIVTYQHDGELAAWKCDTVAICTGLHDVPNMPNIKGLNMIPEVIHSSQFKTTEQFGVGKDILILGTGETGMDIAHMAINSSTNSVTLCHRDGFHVAMKRAPQPTWFGIESIRQNKQRDDVESKGLKASGCTDGHHVEIQPWTPTRRCNDETVPYDVGSTSLFETVYAHPWLVRSGLAAIPWGYYDRFTKWSVALISGTKAGLDQWCGEISKERYHASKIFFNKSTRAMPYISAPYREESIANTLRSYVVQMPVVDTKGRHIDLAPWPKHIDKEGTVHFLDNGRPEYEVMKNKRVAPDMVILATGYSQALDFLNESYPLPEEANMRGIWRPEDTSIGFIGFVRPSFGAIPPLAEMQAQLWVLTILNKLPHHLEIEDHYRLQHDQSSRIQYGVDHESYAYQLACDIESAPSFSDMLQLGCKTTLSWALSSNVNPKFRLVGPWRWSGAQNVMEGEIWETVTRRKLIWGHFTLAFLPMLIFGTASLILFLVERLVVVPFLAFMRFLDSVFGTIIAFVVILAPRALA